jgi:hypothetical protein
MEPSKAMKEAWISSGGRVPLELLTDDRKFKTTPLYVSNQLTK